MSENEFGEEGEDVKFVEVEGKKFVDDGTGEPKKDDDGNPVPFIENQRPPETPEARKIRLDKQTEQHKKKHPELYEVKEDKEPKGKKEKSVELDYGQLAFYNTKSDVIRIESDDDMKFLQETISSTGKDQMSILGAKWFQAELKERQEVRATENALPGNGKRTGASAADTVEYWISKGELPPATPENKKLRQDVVNARMKKDKNASQFTENPVVGKTS